MTIRFAARGILLDIEGTTSSVAFVYDVLFPFARRELAGFLERRWDDPAVQRACERVARDAEASSLSEFVGYDATEEAARERVAEEVVRLMDADAKATGLKDLQGLIWAEGYAAGRLTSHVYPDVPPALKAWAERGLDVRIYSSGSVAAQKVFFAHTPAGDLLPFLRGHYDTTVGAKRQAASYTKIAADMKLPPGALLFVSDVAAELDAARAAGLPTCLAVRPGNAPVPPGQPHPSASDFGQIEVGEPPAGGGA
jgi:enolase-phosphatase E1